MVKVALDADGVLYDFIGGALRHIADRWDIHLQRSALKSASVARWVDRPLVAADLLRKIQSPGFYGGLEPLPGVVSEVARLCRVAQVHLITARPVSTRGATAASVARWFPGISDIHYTRRKARLAKALRIRYAVEDHLPTAEDYGNARVKVWVVKYPFTGPVPRSRCIFPVESPGEAISDIIQRITTMEDSRDGAWIEGTLPRSGTQYSGSDG